MRLFVALDPPESVKDSLADLQTGLPEARWTDIDHLHLTLRFIGEVDAARAGEIVEALDLLEAPAVTLVPRGYGHFERRGKPTILYLAIEPTPALTALQRRIESLLRSAGVAPETRKFTPHITLARFQSTADPARLGAWLEAAPPPAIAPFTVDTVTLFQSRLSQAGATYMAEHTVALERLPDADSVDWSPDPVNGDGRVSDTWTADETDTDR